MGVLDRVVSPWPMTATRLDVCYAEVTICPAALQLSRNETKQEAVEGQQCTMLDDSVSDGVMHQLSVLNCTALRI